MKNLLLISIALFFAICSKSWALPYYNGTFSCVVKAGITMQFEKPGLAPKDFVFHINREKDSDVLKIIGDGANIANSTLKIVDELGSKLLAYKFPYQDASSLVWYDGKFILSVSNGLALLNWTFAGSCKKLDF